MNTNPGNLAARPRNGRDWSAQRSQIADYQAQIRSISTANKPGAGGDGGGYKRLIQCRTTQEIWRPGRRKKADVLWLGLGRLISTDSGAFDVTLLRLLDVLLLESVDDLAVLIDLRKERSKSLPGGLHVAILGTRAQRFVVTLPTNIQP